METPLTVLYTHGLRGDLDTLPRLYSFLRQLKAHYSSEEVVQVCSLDPAQPPGRMLLLDLGDSCAPDVWHCQVSGGRSTLVLLDGMGYDAARVDDATGKQAKMGDGVRLALVDGERRHMIEDVLLTSGGGEASDSHPDRPYTLHIDLTPAPATRLEDNHLSLAALDSSQKVGVTQLANIVGRWTLTAHEIHELPRRILPDPTIAASVEFVVSEARYAQKRRSSQAGE